jgi:hypothetical protein
VAILPFVFLVVAAFTLGVRTLGAAHLVRGARWGALALTVWAACAATLPDPFGWAPCSKLINLCTVTSVADGNVSHVELFGTAVVAAVVALALTGLAARLRSAEQEDHHGATPFAAEPETVQV